MLRCIITRLAIPYGLFSLIKIPIVYFAVYIVFFEPKDSEADHLSINYCISLQL